MSSNKPTATGWKLYIEAWSDAGKKKIRIKIYPTPDDATRGCEVAVGDVSSAPLSGSDRDLSRLIWVTLGKVSQVFQKVNNFHIPAPDLIKAMLEIGSRHAHKQDQWFL